MKKNSIKDARKKKEKFQENDVKNVSMTSSKVKKYQSY